MQWQTGNGIRHSASRSTIAFASHQLTDVNAQPVQKEQKNKCSTTPIKPVWLMAIKERPHEHRETNHRAENQ
jgi:hypothetical protein